MVYAGLNIYCTGNILVYFAVILVYIPRSSRQYHGIPVLDPKIIFLLNYRYNAAHTRSNSPGKPGCQSLALQWHVAYTVNGRIFTADMIHMKEHQPVTHRPSTEECSKCKMMGYGVRVC